MVFGELREAFLSHRDELLLVAGRPGKLVQEDHQAMLCSIRQEGTLCDPDILKSSVRCFSAFRVT